MQALPGELDGSTDSWGAQLLRFNWLIDTGHLDDAHATLMWILSQPLPAAAKETLQLQAAWFEARFRGDLAKATEWMNASPIQKRTDDGYMCTLARAQAGIAFLERRWTDAGTSVNEALQYCDRIADLGARTLIREGIVRLSDEIAANRA